MTDSKNKIKIAFMTDKIDLRPEKTPFFRTLIEKLSNYPDFEIYMVHYKPMLDEPLYKKVNEIIIPKVSLPWGSHFFSFILFCLTTKERFDIFMWFVPRLYPFFWLVPSKKLVVKAHDGYVGVWTKANMVFWFVLTYFNRYLDAVIGVSEYAKKEIAQTYHVNSEKVFTIYNSLDPIYRPFPEKDIPEVLAKYKIIANKYFLYVGGLQIHKNVKRLIESYILLRQENPEIKEKLIIAGICSNQQIEKICDETNLKNTEYYKDIIFSGFVKLEDIPVFHSGATALVFPSLSEGFGMPVAEAMACGNPVITSNISALPEASGGAAILVNPYDVKDIKEAMRELATDNKKREELIKKGFDRIKLFTWDNCVDDHIALFKKILYHKTI